jgi:hypothetical protein
MLTHVQAGQAYVPQREMFLAATGQELNEDIQRRVAFPAETLADLRSAWIARV